MKGQVLVILAVFDHQSMGHNLDMKGGKFLCKTWTRTDCPAQTARTGSGTGDCGEYRENIIQCIK